MANLSLSSLSAVDLKEYQDSVSNTLYLEVQDFVQQELVDIATLYADSINSTKQRGYIAISVIQPSLVGENDPNYDAIQNGECYRWRFCFVPFAAIASHPDTADLFRHLSSEPDLYKMPVVFVDTRESVGFRSDIYKADLKFSISLFVDLNPQVQEVSKDEKERSKTQPKARQKTEQKLEDGLYDWLRIKGVEVERQVATAKHRLDLWIPNKAMLELKQGRVSGDDVCQAIDYAATYQMPIVLVGSGLSSAASRGIDGFNQATGKDLIVFVTWSGIRHYLSGVLNLR